MSASIRKARPGRTPRARCSTSPSTAAVPRPRRGSCSTRCETRHPKLVLIGVTLEDAMVFPARRVSAAVSAQAAYEPRLRVAADGTAECRVRPGPPGGPRLRHLLDPGAGRQPDDAAAPRRPRADPANRGGPQQRRQFRPLAAHRGRLFAVHDQGPGEDAAIAVLGVRAAHDGVGGGGHDPRQPCARRPADRVHHAEPCRPARNPPPNRADAVVRRLEAGSGPHGRDGRRGRSGPVMGLLRLQPLHDRGAARARRHDPVRRNGSGSSCISGRPSAT